MIEDQWGPIANRSLEHLVSSDEAIIRVRRNILKAARDLSKGIEPPLAWDTRGGAGGADAYGAASRGGRCRGPATPRASAAVDVPTNYACQR